MFKKEKNKPKEVCWLRVEIKKKIRYLNDFYFYFLLPNLINIQGDFESCADILIRSHWLRVELGKSV
jgi:hypothetical protein